MLSRLWRYLTAPVFNATTERANGNDAVIAGQRTWICTIKLYLAAEGSFENPQKEIEFPRPSMKSVPEVEVSYGEDRRPRRDVLELDVYVHVTSVGKYSITPEFPEDRYNFRLIYKSPVSFYVKPSELQIVELKSITAVPGHGNAGSVYRGGMVEIHVTAKDKFGNFMNDGNGTDLIFSIPSCSFSVKMLSHTPSTKNKNYVVKIRCDNVGQASFDLIVSQGSRQVKKYISLPVLVIPPPVSAAKSYLIESDIDKIQERIYEAGQAITFKFQLIDILGNPIPSKEIVQDPEQFRLTPDGSNIYPNWSCESRYTNDNKRSFSVRPSEGDPNICEIEFTPSETGKRWYSLIVAGKLLGKFRIAVLPREGENVDIIQNNKKHPFNRKMPSEIREEILYNKEQYLEFYKYDQKILCLGVGRRHLVGEDYANINNINRVLEKEYPSCKKEVSKDLVSWKYRRLVVFDLSGFERNAALKVFELLSFLVEGQHHYRNEANEFAKERDKWDEMEEKAEKNLKKTREDLERELEKLEDDYEELVEDENEDLKDEVEELKDKDEEFEEVLEEVEELEDVDEEFEKEAQELEDYYQELEDKYRIEANRCCRLKLISGRKIHENNEKASDAIFKFFNHNRPQSEIDLHGQRVGNNEKLKQLEAKLREENKTPEEIEKKMERERLKRHEAIRKLDERLREFDHEKAKRDGEDWLEIIDGAGHHSEKRGEQKIRPRVKEYLKKKNIDFVQGGRRISCPPPWYMEVHEGALLITFSEYTGKQPCVADFYCTRCTERKWTSTTSWKKFYQMCFKCHSKGIVSYCYPFKLRSVPPERRVENSDFKRGDHRRLCQKCIELGRDCRW